MVKHNNELPNVHLHKWWQRYVKTWFDQPGRKQSRRIARQKKAAKLGVRPIGMLRPIVHPPTQRYNIKIREGRGFTLDELKGVGLSRRAARTIGVAVDHRRRNRSAESLTLNTERLKTYLSKLVMFPRKSKAKKGHGGIPADTPRKDISNVTQLPILQAMPIERPSMKIPARAITEEERKFRAYGALRRARRDAHNVGKRKTEEAAA
eukprot:GHVT01100541.1.p1 GENE.GHVT01100541.1~~GHVT01100541.1.p1  ORF type:complete len:224 (+),score=17.28 GHVT01100541.1:54-674(+)